MVARITKCDDDSLRMLLQDEGDTSRFQETILHLEGCKYCQQSMERLAADESIWSGVQCLLETEPTTPVPATQVWPKSFADSGSESYELDHADEAPCKSLTEGSILRFLDAPRQSDSLGTLDGFEIERVVGHGGMGIVFQAHDPSLDRRVAIKVLAPHLASNGSARKRFQREARAAAAVVHDNVVAIHGVHMAKGLPYIVMPFVRGPSLQSCVERHGPLEVARALRISRQIASGLEAAHRQGLVHRDVKPANVLMEHGVDRVLLTDFGLARAADDASLTRTGVIAGTPHYMSPEQASGGLVDCRSDLFGLGSVLYFMLTGRPPFRADSTLAVLKRIRDDQPQPIRHINVDVPAWLQNLCERLLEKRPQRRFENAGDVVKILDRCLSHVQEPYRHRLPSISTSRTRRRLMQRSILVSGGVALLVASGFIAARPFLSNHETTAPSAGHPSELENSSSESRSSFLALSKNDQIEQGLDESLIQTAAELDRIEWESRQASSGNLILPAHDGNWWSEAQSIGHELNMLEASLGAESELDQTAPSIRGGSDASDDERGEADTSLESSEQSDIESGQNEAFDDSRPS